MRLWINLASFVLNAAILLYCVVTILKRRRRGNSKEGTKQTKQLVFAVIAALLTVNFGSSLLYYLPFARGRYVNLETAGLLTYLSRAYGTLRISMLVFVSLEVVALLILGIRTLVKKQRVASEKRAGTDSDVGGVVPEIITLILGVVCIGGGIYLNYFYDSQRLSFNNYSFSMDENGISAISKYSWMPPVATVLIILGVVLLGLGIFLLIRRSLATNTVAPQVASGAVQQIKPVTVQQGVAAPAAQIYCSQCGAQNPHEGKFCKECGAALHKME